MQGAFEPMEASIPDRLGVQVLLQKGLAKMVNSGIEFRKSWTYEEIRHALRELFPRLFEYLDNIDESAADNLSAEYPPWVLCVPRRRRLAIVPNLHPDGATVHFNKSTSRGGYRESYIYIGEYS